MGELLRPADTIKDAVDQLPERCRLRSCCLTMSLRRGVYLPVGSSLSRYLQAGEGFTPVLDGEDTYTGFFIVDSATITFKDLTFTHFNTTTYPGAALRVDKTDLNVFNCEFNNNSSVNGGAVFVNDDNSSTDHQLVLSESTLTQNTAVSIDGSGYGGALLPSLCRRSSYRMFILQPTPL